jgi:hypothetical protein
LHFAAKLLRFAHWMDSNEDCFGFREQEKDTVTAISGNRDISAMQPENYQVGIEKVLGR